MLTGTGYLGSLCLLDAEMTDRRDLEYCEALQKMTQLYNERHQKRMALWLTKNPEEKEKAGKNYHVINEEYYSEKENFVEAKFSLTALFGEKVYHRLPIISETDF